MKAGVSACIVDGFRSKRLQPLIEVAIARFEEYQEMRRERDEATATQKLADRKLIDHAKGALMKARNYDEDTASALRKLAMDRGVSLNKVAKQGIEMADLLL